MRYLRKGATIGAAALAVASLSGCAAVPKLLSFLHLRSERPQVAVRPTATASLEAPGLSPADRVYEDAKRAIEVRDYARALDLLQLAKQRTPNDGRVLNALGVVYDKLGRFDLSARYYQLALAAEPNSPVVLANMRYSEKLQTYSDALRDNVVVAAAQPPIKLPIREAPASPDAAQPHVATGPVLVGSSLVVVNASGQRGAQDQVRRRLASVGWTVSSRQQAQPRRDDTVIVFGKQHRRVAEALARTLPFPSTLKDCTGACPAIELVLGANARRKGWS